MEEGRSRSKSEVVAMKISEIDQSVNGSPIANVAKGVEPSETDKVLGYFYSQYLSNIPSEYIQSLPAIYAVVFGALAYFIMLFILLYFTITSIYYYIFNFMCETKILY
jgi:hypothetical protein